MKNTGEHTPPARLPRIAVTSGEPAGIGPDILLHCAGQNHTSELVAIADPTLLSERAAQLGLSIDFESFDAKSEPIPHRPGTLKVIPTPLAVPCTAGALDSANASYVIETLRLAVEGCMNGAFTAMVTPPVQKSIINDAGIPFSGHTEYLAEETGTEKVVMMLASGDLRVALATTHLPLNAVSGAITCELLMETLSILHADLRSKFGLEQPRIAVLGLNPHAGEGGHLGSEEVDTIIPVLDVLRKKGMNLQGPLPADTAFNPKVLDQCDAVFAMYHDQGLPVLKFAGFGNAINITLGLPIIRTSVDHGTALDLAGTGEASASSLECAIASAVEMSNAKTV
ncbi:MAG: 4-hydroxythreonine-4-phosphate dehydrogenase PdxA [Halioglobus sp.]